MRPYASVKYGHVVLVNLDVALPSGGHAFLGRFKADDDKAAESIIRKHGLTGYAHSSSLDFPDEYGVPEGVDPHATLAAAFSRVAAQGWREAATRCVDKILEAAEAKPKNAAARRRAIILATRELRKLAETGEED